MSTLGSKLRLVGQPALAFEADRLVAQLEQEKSAASFWHAKATELEETVQEFRAAEERRVEDGDY